MATRTEATLFGGIGCVLVVVGGGFLLALLGGHFHMDLGGLVILFAAGAFLGLVFQETFERGRIRGQQEVKAASAAPAPPKSKPSGSHPGNRRPTPTFVPPWGEEAPDTVTEALTLLTEKFWSRDHPETSYGNAELTVSFASRGVDDTRTLQLVASDETDSVTIRLQDDLGEVFSTTGPWRLATDANRGLAEVFDVVESVMTERLAHVLTADGEHRLMTSEETASLAADGGPVQVRSWLGSFDPSPPPPA